MCLSCNRRSSNSQSEWCAIRCNSNSMKQELLNPMQKRVVHCFTVRLSTLTVSHATDKIRVLKNLKCGFVEHEMICKNVTYVHHHAVNGICCKIALGRQHSCIITFMLQQRQRVESIGHSTNFTHEVQFVCHQLLSL